MKLLRLVVCVGLLFGGVVGVVEGEELFDDLGLVEGFRLSAVKSWLKPNELGVVLAEGEGGVGPRWRLAQWGSRFDLDGVKVREGVGGGRVLSNEGKVIRVHRGGLAGAGVTLEVKGGAEYGGRLREKGESWPHVLIEQKMVGKGGGKLRVGDYERLKFHVEFRVAKCENATELELLRNLHSAQVTVFFAVTNGDKGSDDFGDMIWFGLPLFDARVDVPRGHQAVDGGQEGSTGKFICTLDGRRFLEGATGDGQWRALDCDLVELLKEALGASQVKGFLEDTDFDDLVIGSFNLGWEVTGPYDCAVSVRGLGLDGEEVKGF